MGVLVQSMVFYLFNPPDPMELPELEMEPEATLVTLEDMLELQMLSTAHLMTIEEFLGLEEAA